MAPAVHKKKMCRDKVKKVVINALAQSVGHIEWRTPSGAIGVFTKNEVVEVRSYKRRVNGVGFLLDDSNNGALLSPRNPVLPTD